MAEVPVALIREALARGQSIDLRLRGQSMRPLIPDGSVCTIAPMMAPSLGDVIACARGETLVAHRVLRADGEHVWTRGDSARKPDPPWRLADVLGRVTMVAPPAGGRRRLTARRWRGVGLLVATVQRVRTVCCSGF